MKRSRGALRKPEDQPSGVSRHAALTLWGGPWAILLAILAVDLVRDRVDAGSPPGLLAVGVLVAAFALSGAIFLASGGGTWARATGLLLCLLGAAALTSVEQGMAGPVSSATLLELLIVALAAQQFGAAAARLLALLGAAAVLAAEGLGDLAGYATAYDMAALGGATLLLGGLILAGPWRGRGARQGQRLSASRLQAAARDSTAAVAVFAPDAALQFASPALLSLLGLSAGARAESAGRGPDWGQEVRDAIRAATEGRPSRLEFTIAGVDGRSHVIDGVFFPLDAGAGLVAIDVTDVRRLKSNLPRMQRMETLGLLAGGLAHDFNNLLAVVQGNLDVMRQAAPESGAAEELLEETARACERAGRVLRQLMDYARPRDLSLQRVDLRELLAETAALVRGLLPPAVSLDVHCESEGAAVEVDPGALQQVLVNLIMNARDSLTGGGRIVLRASRSAATPGVDGLAPGDYQVIAVEDTGRGMDEETLARAFEPFFTTKGAEGGSGLGLTTAQSIVERFGGRIVAASRPGEGSTFSVFLPATAPLRA